MVHKINGWKPIVAAILSLSMVVVFSGCGGNHGNSYPEGITLFGTAATGNAMSGYVDVTDSEGNNTTAPIDNNGQYSVEVTDMTSPLIIQAVSDDPNVASQFSYADTSETDSWSMTANVTPLTSLVLQAALESGGLNGLYESWSNSTLTLDVITQTQAVVKTNLAPQLNALGLDVTEIDFFSTSFDADGTGLDALLDQLGVTIDLDTGEITIPSIDIDGSTGVMGSAGSGSLKVTVVAGEFAAPVVNIDSIQVPTEVAEVEISIQNYIGPAISELVVELATDTDEQAVYNVSYKVAKIPVTATFTYTK